MREHPATAVCNLLEICAILHGIKDYRISVHQGGRNWQGYLSWDAISIIDIENPLTITITMNDGYDQATPQNYQEWKFGTELFIKATLHDLKERYGGYQ